MKFEEYWKKNPRPVWIDEFDDFVNFAKEKYKNVCRDADECIVNNTHIGFDEIEDEVEHYLSDFGEAMILLKEYYEKDEEVGR
jgi:hypothetical protein